MLQLMYSGDFGANEDLIYFVIVTDISHHSVSIKAPDGGRE